MVVLPVVLADTQPIALLAVACLAVVLQDARPVSLFGIPQGLISVLSINTAYLRLVWKPD